MPKPSIRAGMLARRRRLTPASWSALSRLAQARFLETPEFSQASVLALYSSVGNEVATGEIHQAARRLGKRVAYPRVADRHLEFVEVASLAELNPGAFGIPEPVGAALAPELLDLILAPGVAFDRQGFRLGYGKGFYDRFLHTDGRRICPVGFCFDFQMVDELPVEAHDVGMHMLITEARTLRFKCLME